MFIIWGSRTIEKSAGSGRFFCPHCNDESSYKRIRLARYFTLYFIPLYRQETLGEYIQCRRCRKRMDTTAARFTREYVEALNRPWVCKGCGNRNPQLVNVCLGCNGLGVPGYEPLPEPEAPALPPPPPPLPALPEPRARRRSHQGRRSSSRFDY